MSDNIPSEDPTNGNKAYNQDLVWKLRIVYLVAIIAWILLAYMLRIHLCHWAEIAIFFIPIIVYGISMINLEGITVETEAKSFNLNYLSMGVFAIIPMMTWAHEKMKQGSRLIQVVTIAMILSIISVLDLWVDKKWLPYIRHLRSILQTAALTLIIYALYILLTGVEDISGCKTSKFEL